ncbi:MAG TPA: AzlC family ABC transporter permease [Xanthobacteraceae bacterium]|nr:AzlC family ABC transporter permease [Xanthobacteraceae bacterium]
MPKPRKKAAPAAKSERPDSARIFLHGARAVFTSVQAMVLFATFIGYGGLCVSLGFPLGATLLSSAVIFAMPSQLLVVSGYIGGNTLPVIALGVFLSAARLLPATVTMLPYLRGKLWQQLIASHFVAVTVWVEGKRLLPSRPANERLPFYFGFALMCVTMATLAAWIGYFLAGSLPRPLAIGLSFLTPMSFLIALIRNARDLVDYLALILGLVLAPLFVWLKLPLDLLWAGLLGGGIAWLIHRWKRARRAA